ncbi:hypothetical protein D8S78_12460 [Natrialba swarupiae]|nr:hypothetical protein [Natrialba swarupiae]
MNDLDPIVAGLNDNQNLNSKEVLELFVDLFTERGPEVVSQEIFTDYLKIKKLEGDEYSELSSEILSQLSTIDIGFTVITLEISRKTESGSYRFTLLNIQTDCGRLLTHHFACMLMGM